MRIVQLTPGAGGMYCGNCLRDNALVAALRRQGHPVTMLPLYLPLKTDEEDESRGEPVFFGGINVYLEQQSALFRRLPKFLHDLLDSPRLLRWVGTRAAQTRPEQVGDLTVSMLRGEDGNQAREVEELVRFLADRERPEVVCLSNALLVGMARRLRKELGAVLVVNLQGEESFVEGLPERNRAEAWRVLATRLSEVDLLVSPSRYYAERIAARTGIPAGRIEVVPNGISLAGWQTGELPERPPVLGYLARMCPEKGLDRLVDAYVLLRRDGRVPGLRLRVAGGCGPGDVAFVDGLKDRLSKAGVLGDVEFLPNLDHASKQAFLRSLSVFSVPAHYGEAFGLYLIEAMAAGVPVVQPRTGAFPELVAESGGGVLCPADDAQGLAEGIAGVLGDRDLARKLGAAGRKSVEERYNNESSARALAGLFEARLNVRRAGKGGTA